MTKKRETKKVQLAQYSLERVKDIVEFLDFAQQTTTRTNMIKVHF